MIRYDHVSKQFAGGAEVVQDLNLEIASGELLVLLGESGSGKTSTLRMANRLIEPSSGRIFVDGRDVTQVSPVLLRRGIGYVIQSIGLFPHLSVAENVATVLRLLRWEKGRKEARVRELLDLVNLPPADFARRMPRELSGGQQQRVGVARALAAGASILLMDEPFGALDPLTRAALRDEFRSLQRRLQLTVLLVTHDMMEALLIADRIAVMRSGRLLQVGTPRELIAAPSDAYVASLLSAPRREAEQLHAITGESDSS
jgi:osmoprotectant transport system ATP-binding protein